MNTILKHLTSVERKTAEGTGGTAAKRASFLTTSGIYTLLRARDFAALRRTLMGAPVVTSALLAEAEVSSLSAFMRYVSK